VADDVLQETYCRFLARNPPAMDNGQTKTYLFRIATNLLHDRWRSGEDAKVFELPENSFVDDVDGRMDIRRAMEQLKPRERELLWLAYVEGMNHKEIATATGLSFMSVRLLLFRARRKAAGLLRPGMAEM
jgi:RNA polymerase sigma-70 factor (ECF subfamily)